MSTTNWQLLLENITKEKVNGIDLAVSNPLAFRAQWSNKLLFYLNSLKKRQDSLSATKIESAIQSRLNLMSHAFSEQADLVKKLFPLPQLSNDAVDLATIAKSRIHSRQHIETYYNNIFRDWVWGAPENKISKELVEKLLTPVNPHLKNIVYLGAGSCRLAYDLHLSLKPQLSLCLDINPFLLGSAHKILNNQSIELYEFPSPAIHSESVAVKHKILPVEKSLDNFHFILGDALNLPFKKESLDIVVTPWLIDILPIDALEFAQRLNYYLKPNGYWLQFGPLGYSSYEKISSYTPDEIKTLIEKNAGFLIKSEAQQSIPYLQSPFSSQKRFENVYLFLAQKNRSLDKPREYSSLPQFLTNTSEKIKPDDYLKSIYFNSNNTIEVLNLINGERSLNDIAQLISKHSQISTEQALDNLLIFFISLFETN